MSDEKMEKLIINAKDFTKKHDYFNGMPISEFLFLTEGIKRSDALFEAVLNAYDIGFRRGYNRAVNERKVRRDHEESQKQKGPVEAAT